MMLDISAMMQMPERQKTARLYAVTQENVASSAAARKGQFTQMLAGLRDNMDSNAERDLKATDPNPESVLGSSTHSREVITNA